MKSSLIICLETILTKYGDSRWRQIGLEDFKLDIQRQLDEAKEKDSGPMKPIISRIKNKIKKLQSIEKIIVYLTEQLFNYSS